MTSVVIAAIVFLISFMVSVKFFGKKGETEREQIETFVIASAISSSMALAVLISL